MKEGSQDSFDIEPLILQMISSSLDVDAEAFVSCAELSSACRMRHWLNVELVPVLARYSCCAPNKGVIESVLADIEKWLS